MLVEVRPLLAKKWHGKTGKESFSVPKVLEVLYDSETGKYATGLTPDEAKKYGKELSLDLSDNFNPNSPHPYWSTKAASIKLVNHTVIYNTERALDFIKVANLKASNKVANSMKEYDEGKFPDATHVIFDEEEEVTTKAGKVQLKQKANVLAVGLSNDEKTQIIQILSKKSVKGKSTDFIDVEIDAIITEKPDEFIKYANMDKKDVSTRASVLEALAKNILTKEGTAVYYMGDIIGQDYEDAVKWFNDPNNQKIKVSILEKLNK